MIEELNFSLNALKGLLLFWRESQQERTEKLNAAISAVQSAALETRAYLADIEKANIKECREKERELSCFWLEAHQKALEAKQHDLADKCLIKADGWADERMWEDPRYSGVEVGLNEIIDTCRALARSDA